MADGLDAAAAPARDAAGAAPFDLRPLLVAGVACTMAMMAFVSLIGPIARVLGLAPWQAGAAVTVSGVLWMLLARVWGAASDRRGRRPILLACIGGFAASYAALCVFIDAALHLLPPALLAFAGLMIGRGAIGAFYAGVPAAGFALVADHLPAHKRAAAMATLGAASGVGMVVGPAAAALLATYGLGVPLYATAVLPPIAFAVLWHALPRTEHRAPAARAPLRLRDHRLARPMAVAFVAMLSVSVAQIVVGFFVLDRLGLDPAAAARTTGIALTTVGVALIASQLAVRTLSWPPRRLIRIGCIVAAIGFGGVVVAGNAPLLWACHFVAAAGMGWVFPSFSALAANAVEGHEQGAAAGTIAAAQGFAMIVGPVAGTAVYAVAPEAPYLLTALLLAACGLWPAARPAPR